MRIGFYTHYAHCDEAYLVVRLAQLLRKNGLDFDIYSDKTPGKLGLPYDKLILTKNTVKFTDWAKRHSVIIWTAVPKIEQITYAKRHGIRTVIAPMWQDLIPPFRRTLRAADHVVTMSAECQTLFTDIYRAKNAELIPFDTGLPITKKTVGVNPRSIKVLLPWFDRNARCTGGTFIEALRFIVAHMEELTLTVAISPSRFSPAIAKCFKTLSKAYPDRLRVIRSVPVNKRPQLYAANDLTLIPAECDNYGICALTSITMGTPVLTTAVPPQTDFLFPDNNAVLLTTKLDYDENGVVHALPDYEQFVYLLQELIAEPRYIQKMNQKTNYNLASRRNAFEMSWNNIFDT